MLKPQTPVLITRNLNSDLHSGNRRRCQRVPQRQRDSRPGDESLCGHDGDADKAAHVLYPPWHDRANPPHLASPQAMLCHEP